MFGIQTKIKSIDWPRNTEEPYRTTSITTETNQFPKILNIKNGNCLKEFYETLLKMKQSLRRCENLDET